MGYYLTIGLATFAIALLALKIWQKTHSVAFIVGIAFIYYWTLYGAWTVISAGGEVDTYLYYKMFPVALNADYFLTMVLYTAFIVVIELTVLWRAKPLRMKPLTEPIAISHFKLLAICGVAGLIAYLLVRDSISFGGEVMGSAYSTIRSAPLFTIYETLLHFSMFPLSIGMAVLFSGRDAKYLTGRPSLPIFLGYTSLIGAQLLFCILVGNRGEAILCFVVMGLFYLTNARRPHKGALAILAGIAVVTLSLVKMTRDGTFDQIGGEGLWSTVGQAIQSFTGSTEVLAAHFSLYGVLHKHVPITGGTSFVGLVCSVIPRPMWPGRPDPIYYYYIQSVGAVEGQGYTIHHATGWYLNFGVAGLLVGAYLLGLLWVELYNRFETAGRRQGLSRLFALIGFWTLTAGFPAVLREGPEVYKQIAIDYMIAPMIALAFAASTLVLRQYRPSMAIARPVRLASRTLWVNR